MRHLAQVEGCKVQTAVFNVARVKRALADANDGLRLDHFYRLQCRLERCYVRLELKYGGQAGAARYLCIKRRFYRWANSWKAVSRA